MQITSTHCNSLQLTTTHCNTLQHTATHCNTVCCSVWQCVTVCCSVLQCDHETSISNHKGILPNSLRGFRQYSGCSVLQCVAVSCSVLHCVAVCCSVLQCVAVCCSVLQCDHETLISNHKGILPNSLIDFRQYHPEIYEFCSY